MHRALLMLLVVVPVAVAAGCGGGDGDATPTVAPSPSAAPTAPASPTPNGAAITIDAPAEGASVTIPFDISGTANVFEAVLFVRILDGADRLCERRLMATAGTGTRGIWETRMAFALPGGPAERALTVEAYSLSPRDGSEENHVRRSVRAGGEPPAIVIAEPACNARLSRSAPVTVSGEALVFEAALNLELRDAEGNVALAQTAMALSGIERSPWSTTLDLSAVAPGAYDLVAFDYSARDGSIENEFSIPVVLEE